MKIADVDVERAMVIYAHPDDAEFGCSASMAKWARGGVEVTYVMITNGGSGSSDPEMTREKLVEIRRTEQLAAAELLGVARVEFLGYEDGYLEPTIDVRRDVARVVRKYRPDVIVSQDPTFRYRDGYINHPDHIATAEVVFRTINPDASTRLMFPELWTDERLEPHKPKALFLMRFGIEADYYEDVTDFIELKVKALEAHASQISDWPVADFVRERAKETGKTAGFEFAEGYRVMRI
jgi:LmbE family N-acetylglucosaminyl deacetylase